jgi:hypothetical protein
MSKTMEAEIQVAMGTVAWMLYKHSKAGAHITDDPETRDRWIGDYGASSVFALFVGKEGEKPFAWRHRLKGNSMWHFYEGETFDLVEPEAYEFAPLYLSTAWHMFKLEKSFDALARAAENILEIDQQSSLKTSDEQSVSAEINELKEALDLFKATRQLIQAAA